MSKTATKTQPKSSPKPKPAGKSVNGKKSTKSLSSFITDRFDEFSRSQKDVARYIVDHLDEAAFQTAEELARRANTSSSTVVRFSQALGFEGFPELQQAAIEEYRAGLDSSGSGSALFDFDHSDFEASLAADYANMEATARKLDAGRISEAVEALQAAQRVVIVGMDQMAFFASYMRHMLALLDIPAEVIASQRQEVVARLGTLDEGALLVAFNAGRAHPVLVRALKLARGRGCASIAISDATLSEVAEHAETTLYYSSNGPSYTRSNAALLAIVQALAHSLYARDKAAFSDRIKAFKLK